MASDTSNTPEQEQPKKGSARKATTRKPAAAPPADATPATDGPAAATVNPEPVPQTAQADAVAAQSQADQDEQRRGSLLDGVRANAMGPAAVGGGVAIGLGLLLSVLVPSDPNVLAMIILGALIAVAVGFSVRYLSVLRNVARQFEALVATVIGVHVMSVTGALNQDLQVLSGLGVSGPSFNDALLAALATPPVSTGGIIAGCIAAIIVGWGRVR